MSKKKAIMILLVLLLLAIAAVVGFLVYTSIMEQREIDGHIDAGDAAFAAGDYIGALNYYAFVPQDNRRFREVQNQIGLVEDAIADAALERQIDSYFRTGDAALEAEDFAGALAYYSMVPQTHARYAEAQERKAQAMERKIAVVDGLIQDADDFISSEQFDNAQAALSEAERIYPGYEDLAPANVRLEVASLIYRAQRNYEAETFDQAYLDINAAIALDSEVETRHSTLLHRIRQAERLFRFIR